MAKWVNHPSNFWFNLEFSPQKIMSFVHIQNKIFIVRTRFICCSPSTLCYFKLSIQNLFFYLSLSEFIFLGIPHLKEFHFNKSKLSTKIFLQFLKNRIQNKINTGVRIPTLCPCKILLNSFTPAYIIMCMGHNMYC